VKSLGWAERRTLAVGAKPTVGGTYEFVVWAPHHSCVNLCLFANGERNTDSGGVSRSPEVVEMQRNEFGYFRAEVANVSSGARYVYRLGPSSLECPDPASRFQPEGVHGSSELVDLNEFVWTDGNWKAPTLKQSIFYELHVGTFTREGTLGAATEKFPELAKLGVTTIELMPVAQFPGTRNWGYDGVYPYAVQNSYGGPQALQRFVNAAHGHGLAVALDVVYNHLGPEGNYLGQFGPYFTQKYTTPWGQAINFDGPQSEPVRRYFIDNAIQWIEDYHIDVLRLDAVHGIFDFSATHFLAVLQAEISETAKRLGREVTLVAESNLNDARVLLSGERGGYGIRAQWSDDFHHSMHALLTKEKEGYYRDFGQLADLAVVLRDGWLYQGQYSAFRKRLHGNSPRGIVRSSFLVCAQNHDQVGNRQFGERLSQLVGFEAQKLAAGLVLLSPFVPLLFMGEEYGEKSPFLYFTDHGDHNLVEAVRKGRRAEFEEFGWGQAMPDPQDPETFEKSKLRGSEAEHHQVLRKLYQKLITFRREHDLGSDVDWQIVGDENLKVLQSMRTRGDVTMMILFNFGEEVVEVGPSVEAEGAQGVPEGSWTVEICSSDPEWLGSGVTAEERRQVTLAPLSFVLLKRGKAQTSATSKGTREQASVMTE
jgi:maltooligosyltrehalose trehalohydrolase